MHLGVRCVSVYAFAIENFNRSPAEVDALLSLAESKLVEMSKHGYVSRIQAVFNADYHLVNY